METYEIVLLVVIVLILVWGFWPKIREALDNMQDTLLVYSRTGGGSYRRDYLVIGKDQSYLFRQDNGRNSSGQLDFPTFQAALWIANNANRLQSSYCYKEDNAEMFHYTLTVGGRDISLGAMFNMFNDTENSCLPADFLPSFKKLEEFVTSLSSY